MSKLIVNSIEHLAGFTRPGVTVHACNWTTSNNYLHTGTVKWSTGDWDNSTGTFTCPVDGKYLFMADVQLHRANDAGNAQYCNILPRVNNVDYVVETVGTIHPDGANSTNVNAFHNSIGCALVIDANEDDTIRAYSSYGVRNGTQNHVSIFLLI